MSLFVFNEFPARLESLSFAAATTVNAFPAQLFVPLPPLPLSTDGILNPEFDAFLTKLSRRAEAGVNEENLTSLTKKGLLLVLPPPAAIGFTPLLPRRRSTASLVGSPSTETPAAASSTGIAKEEEVEEEKDVEVKELEALVA